MAAEIEVKYFNTFFLNKSVLPATEESAPSPVWNGSRGIPTIIGGYPVISAALGDEGNWAIEEARIHGGYNNTATDYGVKAYIVEDDNQAVIKSSGLIYSGIFNSRTGVNNTNQFSVGEDITKGLDPANGSIQKLYAEDTNLIIFQENKVSRGLIDKDAIYSAEGGGTLTSSNAVIGQIQAYAGNYGISRDPLSFAVYGYRKYFTDKDRNAVLRLSQDGLTEISEYGMVDFFRDEFNSIDSPIYGSGLIIGGYDIYNKQYVVSLQKSISNPDKTYNTLSFDEQVSGFTSLFDYRPDQLLSLKNNYYSMNRGRLYLHYSDDVPKNFFYGEQFNSSLAFIFNAEPSLIKNFKTINYEGSNGWQIDYFLSDVTGPDHYNDAVVNYRDTSKLIYSYTEGAYDDYGNSFPDILYPPINRAGFDRQENKYKANLVNNSLPQEAEISYGDAVTGIKGFYAVVSISTDLSTDPGGAKEVFAVSTEYIKSSY